MGLNLQMYQKTSCADTLHKKWFLICFSLHSICTLYISGHWPVDMLLIPGGATYRTDSYFFSKQHNCSLSIHWPLKAILSSFPPFLLLFWTTTDRYLQLSSLSCSTGEAAVINSNHKEEKHNCRECPMEKYGQKFPTPAPVYLHL